MKKFLLFLAFIILAGAGYYFYNVYFNTGTRQNPIYAVPGDAAYVLEFDDPFKAWNEFSGSTVWAHMKTSPLLADITHYADSLNDVVTSNQGLSKLLASRPVLLSGHPIQGKLQYFWVVDLKQTSQFAGFRNLLIPVFEKFYTVNVREYHGFDILEMYDEEYHETMYMSVVDNLLIGSYRHTLVESSLDQLAEPQLGRDLDFIEVKEELGSSGLFRIYLQWNILLDHVDEYLTDQSMIKELKSVFKYTGFDLDYDAKSETVMLEGYSSMDDTVSSYYNVFHSTGASRVTIPSILPSNTAFYSGLGFDSPNALSQYLNSVISEDEAVEKTKQKLESFLDISFDEHFFGWMEDEIAAIQTHVDKKDNSGYALIIKASSGDKANESLNYIAQRIKKKTPVKFKQITYREFKINYMSIQGIFRVLFGRLFKKLEKPYYTVIEDYVVFSNSPTTLRHIIDYYSSGNTLAETEDFEEHQSNYSRNSGVFIYSNPKYLVSDSREFFDTETYQLVRNSDDYILCFPMAGLQIVAEDGGYSNKIALKFDKTAVLDDPSLAEVGVSYQMGDSTQMDSIFYAALAVEKQEEPIIPDEIFAEDLDAKLQQEFFDSGELRVEVRLKDGLKHGSYIEYDKEGNIILKGRFRNDKREGNWKEYNEKGNVVKRTRYRDGKEM